MAEFIKKIVPDPLPEPEAEYTFKFTESELTLLGYITANGSRSKLSLTTDHGDFVLKQDAIDDYKKLNDVFKVAGYDSCNDRIIWK